MPRQRRELVNAYALCFADCAGSVYAVEFALAEPDGPVVLDHWAVRRKDAA